MIPISRPKSARTPPSAFPFLQIQLSKSKIREHKPARRRTAGFFRDDRGPTGCSGWEPQSFESLMPYEGGEAVMPANEGRLNNNGGRVSTPHLKILRLFDRMRKNTKQIDLSGLYCGAPQARCAQTRARNLSFCVP